MQILGAVLGLAFGPLVPRIDIGPTVSIGRVTELLFTLGLGTLGIVTLAFVMVDDLVEATPPHRHAAITRYASGALQVQLREPYELGAGRPASTLTQCSARASGWVPPGSCF